MTWRVGDLAWIDISDSQRDKGQCDGELCMLREFIDDHPVVPKAWRVKLFRPGAVDQKIVSEMVLMSTDHPNTPSEWANGPWQPLEHTRYP